MDVGHVLTHTSEGKPQDADVITNIRLLLLFQAAEKKRVFPLVSILIIVCGENISK